VLLDDLLGGLEAVGGRHPEIHQDHIGAEGADHGDTLDPVGGLSDDLDAGVVEHAPEGVADGGGVVDEEHPGAVLGLGHLSLPVLFLGHRRLVPAWTLSQAFVPSNVRIVTLAGSEDDDRARARALLVAGRPGQVVVPGRGSGTLLI
jgi:hypothetical protein